MPTTTRLNDLQLVLLSHAAKNENGSVLPLPDTVQDEQRTTKELRALLRRKLLAEVDVTDRNHSWRTDSDRFFELVLTETGQDALGLGADEQTSGDAEPVEASSTSPRPVPAPGSPRWSRSCNGPKAPRSTKSWKSPTGSHIRLGLH